MDCRKGKMRQTYKDFNDYLTLKLWNKDNDFLYDIQMYISDCLQEITELQDKLSRRNIQIKELKETIKLYQKDSIADVLFCVVCNQDTIHNPDCAVCGSKL